MVALVGAAAMQRRESTAAKRNTLTPTLSQRERGFL
jgi:hypothetical protein